MKSSNVSSSTSSSKFKSDVLAISVIVAIADLFSKNPLAFNSSLFGKSFSQDEIEKVINFNESMHK